jgi:CubicO group peptidase (beta-lactamase class C family)
MTLRNAMRGLRSSLFLAGLMMLVPGAAAQAVTPEADRFFSDPALGETRGLLVMQGGRTLYERYGPGYGPGNRFISWSVAKSVTATLVGALVDDGRLALDAPAPVPAWRAKAGDPRAAITLRHLLHMSPGLAHVEGGEPAEASDTNRALFGDRAGDAAAAAEAAALVATPGTVFTYSTLTSVILADIVGRTVAPGARTAGERRRAMRDFLQARLAGPAAMPTLLCEFDAAGTMLGGSFCHASLRDWGAFGQLYLDGGRVAGRQVVSRKWVDFVRTPAKTDGGYGGHFWVNRPRPKGREDALFPQAGPADAYGAVGHLGQFVVIVPSKQLVVVRVGNTPEARLQPVRDALAALVAAVGDAAGDAERAR